MKMHRRVDRLKNHDWDLVSDLEVVQYSPGCSNLLTWCPVKESLNSDLFESIYQIYVSPGIAVTAAMEHSSCTLSACRLVGVNLF
jgi:hypothetical protein